MKFVKLAVVIHLLILIVCFEGSAEESSKSSLLDKLGMTNNVNRPAVWQDQLGGFSTGGSLHARIPTSDIKLVHFDLPSISAGCGGIDLFGGGFGYINSAQLEATIKNIGTSALSYGVMLTIKSLSPQVADLLENLESMARFMNSQNINSCQIGASLAAGLFPKTQASQDLACQSRKMGDPNSASGVVADFFTARYNCQDSEVRQSTNDKVKEESLLGENYNLVWKALSKVKTGNQPMSQLDKEFLMSLSGTLVVTTNDKKLQIQHKNSLMKDPKILKALVFGENVNDLEFYKCKDGKESNRGECLDLITTKQSTFKSENAILNKVRSLLHSIAEKIVAENKSKEQSSEVLTGAEMHLASTTSIPIIKLISLGAGLRSNMDGVMVAIEDYAESVAFDYVISYLDSLVDLVYEAVSNLEHAQIDGDQIKNFKEELRFLKQSLMEDRVRVLRKLNTVLSVKQNIKQIESMVINHFGEYRS